MESAIDAQKSKLPVKRKTPETPLLTDPRPPPFKFHRIWTEHDEIRFLQGLLLPPSSGRLSFPRDLHLFYASFSASMPQPYSKSQLSEKLRRLRKKFRVISSRLSNGLDPSLLSPHDRDLYNLSKQLWHPHFAASSPFSASACVPNFGFNGSFGCGNDNNENNNESIVGIEGDLGGEKSDCGRLVGVKVEFLPDLEVKCEEDGVESLNLFEGVGVEDGGEGKLSEVDVKFEDCIEIGDNGVGGNRGVGNGNGDGDGVDFGDCNGGVEGNGFGEFCGGDVRGVVQNGGDGFKVEEETVRCDVSGDEVAGGAVKIVMSVFNEAVEEVRKGIVNEELEMDNEERFEKRWREQWGAELDVFAQRMKLIVESSIPKV